MKNLYVKLIPENTNIQIPEGEYPSFQHDDQGKAFFTTVNPLRVLSNSLHYFTRVAFVMHDGVILAAHRSPLAKPLTAPKHVTIEVKEGMGKTERTRAGSSPVLPKEYQTEDGSDAKPNVKLLKHLGVDEDDYGMTFFKALSAALEGRAVVLPLVWCTSFLSDPVFMTSLRDAGHLFTPPVTFVFERKCVGLETEVTITTMPTSVLPVIMYHPSIKWLAYGASPDERTFLYEVRAALAFKLSSFIPSVPLKRGEFATTLLYAVLQNTDQGITLATDNDNVITRVVVYRQLNAPIKEPVMKTNEPMSSRLAYHAYGELGIRLDLPLEHEDVLLLDAIDKAVKSGGALIDENQCNNRLASRTFTDGLKTYGHMRKEPVDFAFDTRGGVVSITTQKVHGRRPGRGPVLSGIAALRVEWVPAEVEFLDELYQALDFNVDQFVPLTKLPHHPVILNKINEALEKEGVQVAFDVDADDNLARVFINKAPVRVPTKADAVMGYTFSLALSLANAFEVITPDMLKLNSVILTLSEAATRQAVGEVPLLTPVALSLTEVALLKKGVVGFRRLAHVVTAVDFHQNMDDDYVSFTLYWG